MAISDSGCILLLSTRVPHGCAHVDRRRRPRAVALRGVDRQRQGDAGNSQLDLRPGHGSPLAEPLPAGRAHRKARGNGLRLRPRPGQS